MNSLYPLKYAILTCGAILMTALLASTFLGRAQAGANLPQANPSRFSTQQWDAAYAITKELPFPQRVAFWGDLAAIDATYVADPLGEGPGATPDPDPLNDFAHVDCVTYVEQVYALALSPSREQFDDTLRKIRYRAGEIDFRQRNHYTVSDWLPANQWFIRDVTEEVGKGKTRPMTKTISRARFFADKGVKGCENIPDENAQTTYIPREKLPDVAKKLRTGDMIIFVVDNPAIIAGHVGLLRVQNGDISLQHASITAKKVVTVSLNTYVKDLPKRFQGFKIARPAEPPTKT